MLDDKTPLTTFYTGWETYQAHLVKAIAPLAADHLSLSAAPHLRSIGVLAAHIIAARVWWFHFVLGEGDPELAPLVKWDDDDMPARTAGELVHGLESTWRVIENDLARWTAADLPQLFQHPRQGQQRTYTRQWIVWHVLEHDLHHGGELSFALGMHGLAAPEL
jgi:uncharacterized damage-inducible protein DinB